VERLGRLEATVQTLANTVEWLAQQVGYFFSLLGAGLEVDVEEILTYALKNVYIPYKFHFSYLESTSVLGCPRCCACCLSGRAALGGGSSLLVGHAPTPPVGGSGSGPGRGYWLLA
jgi:hypothetical protein